MIITRLCLYDYYSVSLCLYEHLQVCVRMSTTSLCLYEYYKSVFV